MSSLTAALRLRSSVTAQRRFSVAVRLIVAVVLILFAIFPVAWIVSASLNPVSTLATQRLIPERVGLGNYRDLLQSDVWPYWTWLGNSVKIASVTSILSLAITTVAAFAFSRFRFRGRQTMLKAILLIQVFPSLLSFVAIFLTISQIGDIFPVAGLGTHTGLILVYLGGAMGLNIWLMKGYLDTVPRDIDESAMVDGATHWQIFVRLVLPLLRPILVVIGILNFIGVYGDFILARILLHDNEQLTLMVGLQTISSAQFSLNWRPFTVGALIGALPIMIIYLALQDQIVGGLTQGSVKG